MKKWFLRIVGWLKRRLEFFLARENEKKWRRDEKLLNARTKARTIEAQNECEHVAGCNPLSETMELYGKTSIVWHHSDLGIVFGLCTVCQRQFWPTDPDYTFWRKQPSLNKMSGAGYRMFFDPVQVTSKFLKEEVRPFELDPNARKTQKTKGFAYLNRHLSPPLENLVKELDSLSDLKVKNLWEKVREYRKTGVEGATEESGTPKDPWLLNDDGTPDQLAIYNVDFTMPEEEKTNV